MFFTPDPDNTSAAATHPVARDAYLVGVPGHCAECHAPGNFLGGPDKNERFTGAKIPEGKIPNLTSTRLKMRSGTELKDKLMTGTAPSGDVAVEPVREVITNTPSQSTSADTAAMITYRRTLAARPEPKPAGVRRGCGML